MVFGYLRVSSDRQDTDSQKIGVVKKSEELGLPINEWIIDDGVSGVKEYSKRNLGLLMDKIKEGDIIIVSEISRLARSVFMLFRIVEHCIQTNNCIIYAVKENQVFKRNDVVSAIILSAYGTAAQIEREMIIKRTSEGLERRRRAGAVFGKPVGYISELKIEKVHDKLLGYIKQGLSKQKIAGLLGCNKTTLDHYLRRKKINYRGRVDGDGSHHVCFKFTENYKTSIRQQKILNRNKNHIVKWIKEGVASPNKILAKIKDKGFKMGISSLRLWFSRNPSVYSLIIKKHLMLRKLHNKKKTTIIQVPVVA
ncbi:MAG: recombinase family protein [Fibromonadaceae bacterium]|jgi:DNA invertase Pin-like site-specific DNA recombinase|nr:recombinase family protein [Fibromonadaceae bacterium]